MDNGYIKIYRSSLKDPMYFMETFTKWQAWCDLLQLAYFADSTFFVRGIKVVAKRGCVYRSVLELADRWRWSRGKVERFISYLVDDEKIDVQKSNVINCISIRNYDKYQQNGPTNEPTNEPTNGPTTIRRIKKKNDNILFPQFSDENVSPSKKDEQIAELQSKVKELEGKLEKPKKTTKPKDPAKVELNKKARECFEEHFRTVYGEDYYWSAKDAGLMTQLLNRLRASREAKGMPIENEDLLSALKAFLSAVQDGWVYEHFDLKTLVSQYNTIVIQARNNLLARTNGTGTINRSVAQQQERQERANDAANIVAKLLAEDEQSGNA